MIAADPDLIFDFGSVRNTYADLADRVQGQTGIPYVLVDGRFEATAEALRLMGEILGVEDRAERLARDVEGTLARIDALLAEVPDDARPRVYLARGPAGLETGTRGSINTEIIERAGGINVADAPGRGRIVQASIEQVIVADPDTIVTWSPDFHRSVRDDPLRAGIEAVREGRVFLAPSVPFGWIDRPPSINRMMGLKWMAATLWPGRWEGDLRAEVAEFYRLYYQVKLTEDRLDTLMRWQAGGPAAVSGAAAAARRRAARLPLGIALAGALAALGFAALMIGPYPLSPGAVVAALTGLGAAQAEIVVWQVRLPRVAAALLVGAALAAGAAYRTLFRNPLVSPDILGVSAMAGLGAVLGIFLSLPVLGIQLAAFAGGLGAVGLVLVVAAAVRTGDRTLILVLTGVVVGALAGAATSLVKVLADPYDQLPAIAVWLLGPLAAVTPRDVAPALPAVAVGLRALAALRSRINVLAMGDEEARALGV